MPPVETQQRGLGRVKSYKRQRASANNFCAEGGPENRPYLEFSCPLVTARVAGMAQLILARTFTQARR